MSPESPARAAGIGRALMLQAEAWARETKARGLFLRTAIDNVPAQTLYEALGNIRDIDFYRYDRILERR